MSGRLARLCLLNLLVCAVSPTVTAEEAAPATEEAAADPSTDAAADALKNLSVGT